MFGTIIKESQIADFVNIAKEAVKKIKSNNIHKYDATLIEQWETLMENEVINKIRPEAGMEVILPRVSINFLDNIKTIIYSENNKCIHELCYKFMAEFMDKLDDEHLL